jgi:hypothetical protein
MTLRNDNGQRHYVVVNLETGHVRRGPLSVVAPLAAKGWKWTTATMVKTLRADGTLPVRRRPSPLLRLHLDTGGDE